jgi:hypothetical protein
MQRISFLFLIIGVLLISSCTSFSGLESKKKDLAAEKSFIVADRYIDYCKTQNQTLVTIDLSLLNTDLSDNPELKRLRTKVDSSIVNIRNYLMSVAPYKNLIENADQYGVRNREFSRAQRSILDSLSRASGEYWEMRENSLSLIRENNLKIITLIVDDYKKREEEIPLNWIPRNIMVKLLQSPDILKIDKKIESIDNDMLKKFGNKNGVVAYFQ